MKGLFLAILFFMEMINGYSQSKVEDLIIGHWTTVDHLGDSGKFYFDKNKTMYISTPKGILGKGEVDNGHGVKAKMLMKYELNTKEEPTQIDFYLFVDNFYNPVGKWLGIIEALDDNTMWLAINFDKSAPTRPKDFKNVKESNIIYRSNVKNEVKGCGKFRNGKFKSINPIIGTTIIERKDNFQLETSEKGEKVKFRVDWINNCSYNVAPIERLINNVWLKDTTGLILNVRIVNTKKRSYVYTASFNKSRFRANGEIIKIRD